MTPHEFESLVRSLAALPDETEWVEFKHNNENPEEIGQYISALSNSAALGRRSAAYIVWGIENGSHQIVGTTFKPRATKVKGQELENWLITQLDPQVGLSIQEGEIGGQRVVLFEVQPANHRPVAFRVVEYIRVGSYKKKLKDHPEKERALWRLFDEISFKNGPVVPPVTNADAKADQGGGVADEEQLSGQAKASQYVASVGDLERFTQQTSEATAHCRQAIPREIANLGFRETIIHPARFARHRFTIPELESMAQAASVRYWNWPYIFFSEKRADRVTHLDEGLEMLLAESGAFQFWRLHQSGLLYVNELFHEDERRDPPDQKVLGTNDCAYVCAEAVQCLVDLFTGHLEDDEVVRLHIRLHGVRGRTLATPRGGSYFKTPYECQADQIVYETQYTLADWRAGVIPHAIKILRHVERKFQAPGPPEDVVTRLMQRLLNREL